MIRIAIYDDNKYRRESLEAFIRLSGSMTHAGSFANCGNVVNDIAEANPELVLMDLEMPEVNGIAGIKLIKKHHPHVKIIVQTSFDDDDNVFAAIKAGAEGYILKSAGVMQLSQCIDEVLKGGAMMSPSIALKVMRYFDDIDRPQREATPDYGLSPKELEVLRHLAEGKSHKMVADAMGNSYFTINNHVKKIYQKLQVHCITEAIATAQKSRLI